MKALVLQIPDIHKFPVGPDFVYEMHLKLYFERLENPGWFEAFKKGARKGERKATTRYKRIDADNRVKFLQDSMASVLGIDDCQIFRAIPEKHEDPKRPRAVVRLFMIDRDQFFRS
jgi:hypothetical protein